MGTERKRGFGFINNGKLFIFLCIGFFAALITAEAGAADLGGSKDHPLVKRFGGSEIVGYDTKHFIDYELQTSTFERYNLETKKREYATPPLTLEGSLTRIWYEAAGDASAVELIRNYENELTAQRVPDPL